jgi:hypothetical protein
MFVKRKEVEESLCKLGTFYCNHPGAMDKVGMAPAKLRPVNCTMDGKLQVTHEYLPTFNTVDSSKKAVVYLSTSATVVYLMTSSPQHHLTSVEGGSTALRLPMKAADQKDISQTF